MFLFPTLRASASYGGPFSRKLAYKFIGFAKRICNRFISFIVWTGIFSFPKYRFFPPSTSTLSRSTSALSSPCSPCSSSPAAVFTGSSITFCHYILTRHFLICYHQVEWTDCVLSQSSACSLDALL